MKECINRTEYVFKLFNIKREINEHKFVTSVINKIDFEAYEKNKDRTKALEINKYKNNDFIFNETLIENV